MFACFDQIYYDNSAIELIFVNGGFTIVCKKCGHPILTRYTQQKNKTNPTMLVRVETEANCVRYTKSLVFCTHSSTVNIMLTCMIRYTRMDIKLFRSIFLVNASTIPFKSNKEELISAYQPVGRFNSFFPMVDHARICVPLGENKNCQGYHMC